MPHARPPAASNCARMRAANSAPSMRGRFKRLNAGWRDGQIGLAGLARVRLRAQILGAIANDQRDHITAALNRRGKRGRGHNARRYPSRDSFADAIANLCGHNGSSSRAVESLHLIGAATE